MSAPAESAHALSLVGARVLVTRAQEDQEGLALQLRARGATVLAFPCIEFAPPEDPGPLDAALSRLIDAPRLFASIAFTSPHAVNRFVARLRALGADPHALLASLVVGAAGDGTARALAAEGVSSIIPSQGAGAEPLARALLDRFRDSGLSLTASRVLLPQAAESSPGLAEALRAAGLAVEPVALYRTCAVRAGAHAHEAAHAALRAGQIDVITFASGSAARGFAQIFGVDAARIAALSAIVCMGSSCAEVARGLGFTVAATGTAGLVSLVDAVEACYAARLLAGAAS